MNTYPYQSLISAGLFLLINAGIANAQQLKPLNLNKDFLNKKYHENRVKRVKKTFKSAAAQWSSTRKYDADGYLVSFENDSEFVRQASLEGLPGFSGEVHYDGNRENVFILNGQDTIHRLHFDERKNLVHRIYSPPAKDSVVELRYYYGDGPSLKFITRRSDPSLDKWVTVQSFSPNYRDGKLRSLRSDTSHTMYSYDNTGRLAEEYDSVGRRGWKKYEYDEKDRVIAVYEMRPGNKDFTFCPFFTRHVYNAAGQLEKMEYATSAKNDKMGNCGYVLASSATYKYKKRTGFLTKETAKNRDGSSYTIKYKYK